MHLTKPLINICASPALFTTTWSTRHLDVHISDSISSSVPIPCRHSCLRSVRDLESIFAMIRRPQRLLPTTKEDDPFSGQFPVPVVARGFKYWARSHHRHTTKGALPVEDLDLVQVIEARQPWEQLKLPILCSYCGDRDLENFDVTDVHWEYLHCTKCQNYFLCGSCVSAHIAHPILPSHLLPSEHGQIIIITSRPYWWPCFDGSDIDQLVAFRDKGGNSHDDFFLYFPWFFHGFEGMDYVRLAYQRRLLQDSLVHSLASMSLEIDHAATDNVFRFVEDPVDWYMRIYATGNWKELHQRIQPLVDERIHTARQSQKLNVFLEELQGFVHQKSQAYGSGDITCNDSLLKAAGLAEGVIQGPDKFLAYLVPLQMTNILNTEIDKEKVQQIIHVGENGLDDPSLEASLPSPRQTGALVSAGNLGVYPAPISSHLSNLMLSESQRLWPMFRSIFKDDERFATLKTQEAFNDFTPSLEHISSDWAPFLSRDLKIRTALYNIRYPNLPTNLHYLASLPNSRPHEIHLSFLGQDLPRFRLRGEYDAIVALQTNAIRAKHAMHIPYTEDILELQLAYLEQGYLMKAASCLRYLSTELTEIGRTLDEFVSVNPTAACIFAITLYTSCFFKADGWENALTIMPYLFQRHCLAAQPVQEWMFERQHTLSQVRLELIFHRFILEVYRDILRDFSRQAAIERLQNIQTLLAPESGDVRVAELMWQAACLEMEILKPWGRDQYFDYEACFSLPKYRHDGVQSLAIIERFRASLPPSDEQRGEFDVLRGHAWLLEAQLQRQLGDESKALIAIDTAKELYQATDCTAGCLDVELFEAPLIYTAIGPLYDRVRARNDMTRLRLIRKMAVNTSKASSTSSVTTIHTSAVTWRNRQAIDLRDLAEEAGDMIACHRWKMRKYAGDQVVGASVQASEDVLKADAEVHSMTLTTLASFNLAKTYLTLGNYFAASLNAMLHLSLTDIRIDSESHQRAILVVLETFTEAIAAEPRLQERLPELARRWNGWLHDQTLHRWHDGQIRCDEIERFIDGSCFLPLVCGRAVRKPENGILSRQKDVEEALLKHLRIAFDLYSAMPTYSSLALVPRLSRALGAAATYIGNLELAIRSYGEGLSCCHSEDELSIRRLRSDAGKAMTLLADRDPENWIHLVDPGRRLLAASADTTMMLYSQYSGSALHGAEAHLSLLSSLLDEARGCQMTLDLARSTPTGQLDVPFDPEDVILRVAKLTAEANEATGMIERAFDAIVEGVKIRSPFELNYNLVHLADSHILREARQLALELGFIAQDLDQYANRQRGVYLWSQVQRFKGTVLGHQYHQVVPSGVLQRIKLKPDAWKLYQEEEALKEEIPWSTMDGRLVEHQIKMLDVDELRTVLERRRRRGVSMDELSTLAVGLNRKLQPAKTVILIDWILYRDRFLICGFDALANKLCMLYRINGLSVVELEDWVRDNIDKVEYPLKDSMNSKAALKSLHELVTAIAANCEPGSTLIFSPSLCLNRVPLHAIPYAHEDDEPVIHYHPVMYAPSCAALKDCVERALAADVSSQLKARLFNCYKTDEEGGTQAMENLAVLLQNSRVSFDVKTRDGISRDDLKALLSDADLVHFHGHVNGKSLSQTLVLDDLNMDNQSTEEAPDPEQGDGNATSSTTTGSGEPDTSTQTWKPADGGSTEFKIQDIYSSTLLARLVFLIGCGSGQLVVSRGDDALGLVNGFLSAGATTVIGTLWPLDNQDGRDFMAEFYTAAFGKYGTTNEEANSLTELVDMAAAIQDSVLKMRTCKRPACVLRKSPERRLRCHPTTPYHWASFVGWGSWVLRVPQVGEQRSTCCEISQMCQQDAT
ncbi:CHAT domain-containing protein [Stachybotrys elegans]|uniref:CHAT domain-containing protein n=1 Tax=Stachybotrys elegans TaxID=80388 RepID=A0A8K0SYY9_9HYPO|nr:CHAT domain-containing protein [Stachybotrys elegans]